MIVDGVPYVYYEHLTFDNEADPAKAPPGWGPAEGGIKPNRAASAAAAKAAAAKTAPEGAIVYHPNKPPLQNVGGNWVPYLPAGL
jgi:hypothetical protein